MLPESSGNRMMTIVVQRQPVQNGTSYTLDQGTIYDVTVVLHWLWNIFLFHYYLITRSRRYMAEILPIRRNTPYFNLSITSGNDNILVIKNTCSLYLFAFPFTLGNNDTTL